MTGKEVAFIMQRNITMEDVICLLSLPEPSMGRTNYNIPCPKCDQGRDKHLNINLTKGVFCCPRCQFQGGTFDLYAYYTDTPRSDVRRAIYERLGMPQNFQKVDYARKRAAERAAHTSVNTNLLPVAERDKTYRELLNNLELLPEHRQNLRNRGLSDDAIDSLGYRSCPVKGSKAACKRVISSGCKMEGVPGMFKLPTGEWDFVSNKSGILVPVRNEDGLIQGLQLRLDDTDKRKYRWVSSDSMPGGTRAETWAHLSGSVRNTVYLTEGPMKADIIRHFTNGTVIAVPGVNAIQHLQEMLTVLKGRGLIKVDIAFDMDMYTNPHVQSALVNLKKMLSSMQIYHRTLKWDTAHKGLDDHLWAMYQAKKKE